MSDKNEPPTLNMSAIPVAGVGGLGLLGIVAIMAFAFSPARWLLFSGIVGGWLVALALVMARRRRRSVHPGAIFRSVCFPLDRRSTTARRRRARRKADDAAGASAGCELIVPIGRALIADLLGCGIGLLDRTR